MKISLVPHLPCQLNREGRLAGHSAQGAVVLPQSSGYRRLMTWMKTMVRLHGVIHRGGRVFSSDLPRDRDTCDFLFGSTSHRVVFDARIRPTDFGELTGAAQTEADYANRLDTAFPGGESLRDVVERYDSFLRDRSAECRDGQVILVFHSSTPFALDHLCKGLEVERALQSMIGPSEEWRRKRFWTTQLFHPRYVYRVDEERVGLRRNG